MHIIYVFRIARTSLVYEHSCARRERISIKNDSRIYFTAIKASPNTAQRYHYNVGEECFDEPRGEREWFAESFTCSSISFPYFRNGEMFIFFRTYILRWWASAEWERKNLRCRKTSRFADSTVSYTYYI